MYTANLLQTFKKNLLFSTNHWAMLDTNTIDTRVDPKTGHTCDKVVTNLCKVTKFCTLKYLSNLIQIGKIYSLR